MSRGQFTPRVQARVTRVWSAHPVSVAYARAIARVWGPGISGGRGHKEIPVATWDGYAQAGVFTGWNPGDQLSTGTPLTTPGGLPGTSLPLGSSSPLDSAVAQIMAGSSSR